MKLHVYTTRNEYEQENTNWLTLYRWTVVVQYFCFLCVNCKVVYSITYVQVAAFVQRRAILLHTIRDR